MDKISLCIDIGNTTTKAGVFKQGEMIDYIKPFTHKHFEELFREGVAILVSKTGENPKLEELLSDEHYLSYQTPIPIKLNYNTPETLGADRIAAAVGAHFFIPDSTCLIIDIGTCLTIDLLHQSEFLGGVISPGMDIRFKAMNQFTTGLPLVAIDDSKKFPGKSTVESIQVGVSQSIRNEILGYIQEQNELYNSLKIVFCGENIFHFDKVIKNEIFARPKLVLEGLNQIIQHNA